MRAVIFDLDGTLVDSNELHVEAWDEAFRHFGKEFSKEKLRKQIGKGGDQYLPEFLNEFEIRTLGAEIEQFRSKLFTQKYRDRVRPFPQVRELLQRVRDDGKKIALATSGNESETKFYLKLLHISDLVDAHTSKNDVARSKPQPDIFLRALNLLHLPASDAIVIGDTPYDIEAAKKIGLSTIAVLCGGFSADELRAEGAIAIFHDPADLLANYQRSPLCA